MDTVARGFQVPCRILHDSPSQFQVSLEARYPERTAKYCKEWVRIQSLVLKCIETALPITSAWVHIDRRSIRERCAYCFTYKTWWIFQQSWCLCFPWSRVFCNLKGFGIHNKQEEISMDCLMFQQATVHSYPHCAGCPCITPAGEGRRETLGLSFQPHHFGVHQGGWQFLAIECLYSYHLYSMNQPETTVFET